MSDRTSSELFVVTFYTLATFWVGIKGICDVDVHDATWSNFTFSHWYNDTSEGDKCEDIFRESETSIFVLKIVSENPLQRTTFMIRWKDTLEREVNEATTSEGVVKFINSTTVAVCCRDNICVSNLLVFYTELQRGRFQKNFQEDDGLIKTSPYCRNGRYRPNGISFWGIEARNGSVKLTVEEFDLDDYAGDYLLIGSSVTNYGNTSDVFQGPSPLFLTGQATKPKNIIVSTSYQSQVYVVLVAKTMKREDASGFTIRYQADGERIGPVSTKQPVPTIAESWKEAISVCATVPKNDSNDMVNSTVTSFLVDCVLEEIRRDHIASSMSRSQIKVIMLAWQRQQEDEYVTLLTVESWDHPNVPLLKADQLRDMFKYRSTSPPSGYKILLCDQLPVEGEWLKSVALAFVPIFLLFLLLLWWFRHNKFLSSIVRSNEKKPTLQVEMFPVIMTNPAFVPDSPSEETELPPFFLADENKKNKLDFNNKDSGFASCSTHPSSVKSTPRMTKRKVLFDIAPKEEEQENSTSRVDVNFDHNNENIIRL